LKPTWRFKFNIKKGTSFGDNWIMGEGGFKAIAWID
jgi:hypothetical protein